MADLPISGLPAVVTPAITDEFASEQSGVTKKYTAAQISDAAKSFAAFMPKSILYAGSSGEITENNTDFTWDNTNHNMICGDTNTITTQAKSVALGGRLNSLTGSFAESAIIGGTGNIVANSNASVIGGSTNSNSGAQSTILGGNLNTISSSGAQSTIGFGTLNNVRNSVSFAGGKHADVNTTYSFFLNLDSSAAADVTTTINESFCIIAKGGAVFGDKTPVSTSEFSVVSTTKGSIPAPKMDNTEMLAISTPATALQVYNTDIDAYAYYNGTSWTSIGNEQTTLISDTASGPWAASQNLDIRIGFISDSQVAISIEEVVAAATVSNPISITTLLPTAYRPVSDQTSIIKVEDNGSNMFGEFLLSSTGTMSIYSSIDNTAFTGVSTGGSTGFKRFTIVYDIAL